MIFYKIAGGTLILALGIVGSHWLNKRAGEALERIDGFLAFLRYVKIQIECFSLPISEIMLRCEREMFIACGYNFDTPPSDFAQMVTKCNIADGECEKILLDFGSSFGKSYREEQLRQCEYYINLLSVERERLSGELPTKKKLNSTLCISASLAVIILLI